MLAPIPLGKYFARVRKALQQRGSRYRQTDKRYADTPIIRRFPSIGQSELKFPSSFRLFAQDIFNLFFRGWNGGTELFQKVHDNCLDALN